MESPFRQVRRIGLSIWGMNACQGACPVQLGQAFAMAGRPGDAVRVGLKVGDHISAELRQLARRGDYRVPMPLKNPSNDTTDFPNLVRTSPDGAACRRRRRRETRPPKAVGLDVRCLIGQRSGWRIEHHAGDQAVREYRED